MRKILIYVLLATALLIAGDPKNNPGPSYHVAILEGDAALNTLPSRAAESPIIRVADGSGKPVIGARVEFDAPKAGPGIVFGGGSTHFSTTTNTDGQAKVVGLRNNGVPGGFAVLVHVSYQGQTLADTMLHQTNVASATHTAAKPRILQEPPPDAKSASVLGIAMGDQFIINGLPSPTNTHIAPGNRLQTKESPVTLVLYDNCEFLVGPHSSVIIQPHLLSVMGGAVRAKHFGNCKFGYGGLWVTSPSPTGDAVVSLSQDHLEVGSISGPVEISNALKIVNTVQPGSVSAFNFSDSPAASGATVNTRPSNKVVFMLGVGTGASLLGLGLAIDAISQPSSASPTSP